VQLDRDLADLVDGYLTSRAADYQRSDQAGRVVFDIAPATELAAEIGDGRRFATGDARGLTDAEPLNLVHPLVRAAIADARAWPGGSVELLLPRDATPDLVALAGKVGVLAVALVDYAGFEPVQRLIAGGVVDGALIDPSVAARILMQAGENSQPVATPTRRGWTTPDEAVTVDQRTRESVSKALRAGHWSALERFVDDKVLKRAAARASIAENCVPPKARRVVVGSTAGDRVESEIVDLATKDDVLERRMNALDSREDEVYRKWRNEYHELRYRAPVVTRLFQVSFQIAPLKPGTSC
jgi:hypothetical protein